MAYGRSKVEIRTHPALQASWRSMVILLRARDFYRGDGRGSCLRLLDWVTRYQTAHLRAELVKMGKDPDLILERAGMPRAPVDPPEAYGRVDRCVHD